MNFNEAEILSYTSQNKFLAEGEFRYGSTKVLSITSVIDTKISNSDFSGVKESQEKLMQLISGAHNLQEININGTDFGSGRIISINSETAPIWNVDSIRFGKNTFQIEIQDSGENNLYNMTGNFFTGLKEKFSKQHLLENFDESFTFNLAGEGNYTYEHQVSAKYFSGIEVADPIGEAKKLASGIFEQDPSFGFIDTQRSGFYNTDGKKYFTEGYNLQTNACYFQKRFECMPRYNKNDLFCSNTLYNLSSNEDGIINITERGLAMGLDDDGNDELYESAIDGLNSLISSAYERCNNVFNNYTDFYGGDTTPLNSQYLSLQKSINRISANLEYEISFNNASNISGHSGQHDMTLNLQSSQDGVRTVIENGTITSFSGRGNVDPVTLYNSFSIDQNAPYRCGNFYSGQVNNNKNNYNFFQKDRFNLTSTNLNFSQSGNVVNYRKTFTDDVSIVKTNNINIMNVRSSDVFSVDVSQAYFIPNQQKEILTKRGIKTLASRNINADCVYQKPSNNFWTDISYAPIAPESNTDFYEALKFVKNKMLEKAFDDGWISINNINSMFINTFTYTVGSDQNLSATMNIIYEE